MARVTSDDVRQEVEVRRLEGRPAVPRFVWEKLAARERRHGEGLASEPPARETKLPPEVRLSLTPIQLAVAELLLGGYSDCDVRLELRMSRRQYERARDGIAAVIG